MPSLLSPIGGVLVIFYFSKRKQSFCHHSYPPGGPYGFAELSPLPRFKGFTGVAVAAGLLRAFILGAQQH